MFSFRRVKNPNITSVEFSSFSCQALSAFHNTNLKFSVTILK